MSDLTPDEEREAKWEEYGKAEGLVWDMPFSSERRAFEAGWDAHDAEVAEKALRDAADEWHAEHSGTRPVPYNWLRARADALAAPEQEGEGDD